MLDLHSEPAIGSSSGKCAGQLTLPAVCGKTRGRSCGMVTTCSLVSVIGAPVFLFYKPLFHSINTWLYSTVGHSQTQDNTRLSLTTTEYLRTTISVLLSRHAPGFAVVSVTGAAVNNDKYLFFYLI